MAKKAFKNIKKTFLKRGLYFFIILLILFFSFFFFINKNTEHNSENYGLSKNNDLAESCVGGDCVFRLIDGVLVEAGQENPFIISAIIDNHSDARPQFSLSQATLVYEVPVEGGMNRYLALFLADAKNISEFGPIRSARPYFLSLAEEYQSLLVHCGGSPDALARIIKNKSLSLNEFYNTAYFRRYPSYPAPHNVLANFSKIQQYLSDKNLLNSDFRPWNFADNPRENFSSAQRASTIKTFNGFKDYVSEWTYDAEKNIYLRNLAGRKHLDNNSEQITATNLIFQFVEDEILDDALRLKINLIGKGKALICLDSYCEPAYWKKDSEKDRTIFYYLDDQEVVFKRGKTWIQLLDQSYSLEY